MRLITGYDFSVLVLRENCSVDAPRIPNLTTRPVVACLKYCTCTCTRGVSYFSLSLGVDTLVSLGGNKILKKTRFPARTLLSSHLCVCAGSKSRRRTLYGRGEGGRDVMRTRGIALIKMRPFLFSLMGFTYTRGAAAVAADLHDRYLRTVVAAARLMNDLTVSARRKSYFARVRTLNLYLCVCESEFVLFGS